MFMEELPYTDETQLLMNVLNYYNCTTSITINKEIHVTEQGGKIRKYTSIEQALADWITTMEETNLSIYETGDVDTLYNTWTEEEIELVKGLKLKTD